MEKKSKNHRIIYYAYARILHIPSSKKNKHWKQVGKILRWVSFTSVFRAKNLLEVIVSGLIFLQMRSKTNTQRG